RVPRPIPDLRSARTFRATSGARASAPADGPRHSEVCQMLERLSCRYLRRARWARAVLAWVVIVLPLALTPQSARGVPNDPVQGEQVLLPVRYDTATGRVFLTIPRLGMEFLYLNTLATGFG